MLASLCLVRPVQSPLSAPATRHIGGDWLAAFLIGCLVGIFQRFDTLPVELRLFTTTGVLGGLSTYSTFLAEAVSLLLAGHDGWFALHVLTHLIGSLVLTLLGIYLAHGVLYKWYREMGNPEPDK
ncbi:CrcB family protein [Dyella monticola]|uniref:CrcB family protein n=1 Tax=Dyella monticola TaxID=1927958 RepID=UPI001E64A193|nr:CrcB family protein [Dyella monticola]